MSNRTLTKSIKRNPDGTVDVEATYVAYDELVQANYEKDIEKAVKRLDEERAALLASFDADLASYVETRGVWDVLAAEYVNRCFDRFNHTVKGGCITKPVLLSMCAGQMVTDGKIEYKDLKMAQEMIAAFIDDNSSKPDEVVDSILFTVHKGEGGGIRRVNRPTPEIKA